MEKLMLDTNGVRALIDGRSSRLDGWFAKRRCCLSAIVAAEIHFGLGRRRLSDAVRRLIEGLLEAIEILPSVRPAPAPTAS